MKNIALVDSRLNGHHQLYFKLFTQTLLELGYQVTAFCPKPTELREWITDNLTRQTELLHTFEIQEPEPSSFPISQLGRALTTLARWRQAAAAIKSASSKLGEQPDLVFFPCIDAYLAPFLTHQIVDQIFSYNWAGLSFDFCHLRVKQRFAFARRGFLNRDEVLKSSHCLAVAVQDEGIVENLKSKINGKPIVVFPNTIDQSTPDLNFPVVKQIIEKAGGRKIIGSLGYQSKRKGLLTLLEVAKRALQEDWFFVFAGEFDESSFHSEELRRIQTIVSSAPNNCFFHFRRIPAEPQFNALVSICDILFVVYENYPLSSQMLTLAARFEKPVIANNTYWIGERVQEFNLGLGIPEGDISRCIEALRHLVNQYDSITQWLQPNFEGYTIINSTGQLSTAFQTVLDAVQATGNQM